MRLNVLNTLVAFKNCITPLQKISRSKHEVLYVDVYTLQTNANGMFYCHGCVESLVHWTVLFLHNVAGKGSGDPPV